MGKEFKLALKNASLVDPLSINDYISRGGYNTLKQVFTSFSPDMVIEEIVNSGLRGRGGAGFLTGLKGKFTGKSKCYINECMKYLVCNADEGEPGTFKDSRTAHSSEDSPYSINPPGSAHPKGFLALSMRSIFLSISIIISVASSGYMIISSSLYFRCT